MAASISLFSVGKTILEKLGPLVQQEAALLLNLQAELKKLNSSVTAIHALLLDAEEQQQHSHQVKDWLEKLQVLLFDAEDLLDDVSTEAQREEADWDGGHLDDDSCKCRTQCWTVVRFLFVSLPNRLIYGLSMARKVKSLREQLDAIHADNTKLHLNPRFEEKGKMRKHTPTIDSIHDIVVGRENDVKHIKELLLATTTTTSGSSRSSGVSVISIVGIGGMGKTALAQLVYNDRQVKEHFKLILWACISESFEAKVIVQKVLEAATKEKRQDLELNTLNHHLNQHISGQKYLVVLDDVWDFNPEEWDKLRSMLKSGANGSKILVTTRFENFAMIMSRGSPDPPYALSGLSPSQTWSLFRQVLLGGGEEYQLVVKEPQNISDMEEIKREIVKKTAGVPLAVKTIAIVLYPKDCQTQWLLFLRSNELLGIEQNNSILHNLRLSYDYLPSHLKHCFVYCSLYPKAHEFDVELLIYQWVALGLINKPSNDHSEQSLFDLGFQCFMDLAWRSFFQDIKRDLSNSIRSCKMHDLIHDLAVSVAGSSCKQVTGPLDGTSEKTYHVSLHHDKWCPSELVGHLGKAGRLRTLCAEYRRWYRSGTTWDDSTFKNFVSKFRRLRVLEFQNTEMDVLPHHIQDLKHLRYLSIAENYQMTMLPSSITMLQNLQVLMLSFCQSLKELPRDINKLVNLWVLSCAGCFALTHMPVGLGELTRLETLTWFVVGGDSFVSSKHNLGGGLNELNKLHKLGGYLQIVNLRHTSSNKMLSSTLAFNIGASANLKGKPHLEKLVLRWDDGNDEKENGEWEECLKLGSRNGEWDESLLEGLQPHSNLKALSVAGYKGGRSPSWVSSLTNLVTLYFCWSKMCHGLHHLQWLPALQKLALVGLIELQYVDEGVQTKMMTSSKPFFPSLLKLELLACPKLKGWQKRKQSSQFPKLSKLIISGCPLLTSMPLFPMLDKKLKLVDTSLQLVLATLDMSLQYHPLSRLKKLHVGSIDHLPREWLQGMQHLTSLEEIVIEKCSGLDEGMDWHNISHVPNVIIDHYFIKRDGVFGSDVTRSLQAAMMKRNVAKKISLVPMKIRPPSLKWAWTLAPATLPRTMPPMAKHDKSTRFN